MLQIQPNRGLGPFVLGCSLFEILNQIHAEAALFQTVSIVYSHEEPLAANVVVELKDNGIRLRFDGADQRLRLIEILDFEKSKAVYKGVELSRSDGKPNFKTIYNKIFGPTYDGEYIADLSAYVLSYPGVAFTFSVANWQGDISTDAFLRSHINLQSQSMAIYNGSSWSSVRDELFTTSLSQPRSSSISSMAAKLSPAQDDVDFVRILGDSRIEMTRRYNQPVIIELGKTSPQDVVVELGPPSAIYGKNDDRLSIHRNKSRSGNPTDDTGEELTDENETDGNSSDGYIGSDSFHANAGYFYNYFHYGFDVFFSTHTPRLPTATKLILHGNIPGSYEFQRYRRARWTIAPLVMCNSSKTQAYPFQLHSEMPFSEIQTRLAETFGKSHKPMLLNRASNSPSSSCELLGGWEDGDGKNTVFGERTEEDAIANTELYGYSGFIFEVLRNSTISGLTVY